MNKRTIKDLGSVEGKVVLTRVDFNVPVKNGEVQDVNRINAALPTINYLREQGAKIVLFSHLGRVLSEEDKAKNTLAPVSAKLAEIAGVPVKFIADTRGVELESAIESMNNGEIVMFENTRHEDLNNKAESKNNAELGKY